MQCETIKSGQECAFMAKAGCSFNGGSCYAVIQQCEGCARIIQVDDGLFCEAAPDPRVKWRLGLCNLATHVKEEIKISEVKINPLKASKRAAKR